MKAQRLGLCAAMKTQHIGGNVLCNIGLQGLLDELRQAHPLAHRPPPRAPQQA